MEFPIMADSLLLFLEGRTVFATHGHIYNNETPPKIGRRDILLHGHTHVQAMEDTGKYIYINPGSVSLPKEGNQNSYMVYEDGVFTIKNMEGEPIRELSHGKGKTLKKVRADAGSAGAEFAVSEAWRYKKKRRGSLSFFIAKKTGEKCDEKRLGF